MEQNIIAPKKRIFSAIKPTGEATLGSYLGAIKNWVSLRDDYECLYCIADLHALTVRNDPAVLRRRVLEQLAVYVAAGLDPEKCILYVQSHVAAHAELGWILDCYTMFGELSRMTQFKDKSRKNADNVNGGLFTYPALMAADILLYQTDLVPVGEDQTQHVEICRDIANRFNGVYGDTFTMPEAFVPKFGARVMSLSKPGSKMSKSEEDTNGSVLVMDSPDDIMRKFKRAVTDSDTAASPVYYDKENKPGVANLLNIYCAATGCSMEAAVAEFEGKGYGAFKPAVGEAVVEMLRPVREKAAELLKDKDALVGIYTEGASKAAYLAEKTMRKVRRKVGLTERPRY